MTRVYKGDCKGSFDSILDISSINLPLVPFKTLESTNVHRTPGKKMIKYKIDHIDDDGEDMRKEVLRLYLDLKLKRFGKIFYCQLENFYNIFKPFPNETSNESKKIDRDYTIIICLQHQITFHEKLNYEVVCIVLNNEIYFKHCRNGTHAHHLVSGNRLILSPNKQFYLTNQNVNDSHIMLLFSVPLNSNLPSFLKDMIKKKICRKTFP